MPANPVREQAYSVLDTYHPDNDYYRPAVGSYVFKPRAKKLNLTLGWELEANHRPSRIPNGIEAISDGSVDGDGAEFVVLPAITKSPRYVLGLLKDLVHAPRLNTNKSCGFHVHVSASNLHSTARMRGWAIATEHLALQVEDLAFKAVPESRQENSYCKRITPISYGTTFTSTKYNNARRYHWLNTVEMFRPGGIRTIEIRLLGHTHRWKYLLAWTFFSMELCRRGWEVANNPYNVARHKEALENILISIARDIKPLEKKLEPIPQWVYKGLELFYINPGAWDRPLARLTETEADLHGMPRRVYSDNQPEEASSQNEDEDDNSCPCGCGEDGPCSYQIHNDGDCDSSDCHSCHDAGDCMHLPQCYYCRTYAHENNEDCQRRECSTCHPQPRPRAVPVTTPRPVDPIDMSRLAVTNSSNMTIQASTMIEPRTGLTAESFRSAVDTLRSMPLVSAEEFFRGPIASIVYDEATNILPSLYQEMDAIQMMTTFENTLSMEREHLLNEERNSQGGR